MNAMAALEDPAPVGTDGSPDIAGPDTMLAGEPPASPLSPVRNGCEPPRTGPRPAQTTTAPTP